MELATILKVAAELKPLVAEVKAARSDGKISVEEGLGLAVTVFTVLEKNGVTVADLSELAKSLGPLLPLLKELAT